MTISFSYSYDRRLADIIDNNANVSFLFVDRSCFVTCTGIREKRPSKRLMLSGLDIFYNKCLNNYTGTLTASNMGWK